MLIFLAWQSKDPLKQQWPAATVARDLEGRMAPLVPEGLSAESWQGAAAGLAWLELPTEGWRAASHEVSGDRMALAADYPMNVDAVLAGRADPADPPLLGLAGALERDPERVLHDLVPPCSLLWSGGSDLTLQTDALGQSQLFEYEDEAVFAVTNRLSVLRTLGVALDPVPEEWAVRFSLGWFPQRFTGYRGVCFVAPGTQLRFTRDGVKRRVFDVLARWLHPEAMSPEACIELAAASMRELLAEAMTRWERPTVGLSGGWDSRAVVGILRDLGADMSLRVRGSPDRYDVMIAAELARIAGLRIRIKNQGGFPPDDADGCRRSIRNALRWQAGHMEAKKHKSFLARKPHLPTGVVNVMGQHAGLGKADFVMKIRAWELPQDRYEDALVDNLAERFEPQLHPARRSSVRDTIRESYRQADRYDLEGFAALHFFFLYEYTRRWGSVATASQPGLVVTPYLNPGFIRAAYAFPQQEIRHRPFHRHLHARYAADWAHVPLEDQATEADVESGRIRPVELAGARGEFHQEASWKRGRRYGKYSNFRYWRDVARPLLEEARAAGGFWAEVLDPALASGDWKSATFRRAADPLVVAYLLSEELADEE